MPQPTNYTPTTDFSQQEANNASGRSTVNTAALDAEFANIETTLDQTLSNLQLIQRDDGRLGDVTVEVRCLAPDVLNVMGGFNLTGLWTPATAYAVNDICSNGEYTYVCKTAHTSGGSFSATNWVQFGFTSGADAAQAAANAQASAAAALVSENNSSGHASSASASASAAASSAASAASSASSATSSASAASSSATNAANSASAAASAAASAITLTGTQTLQNKTLDGTNSLSGNLSLTGTGARITGDFSNATLANRVLFQTSTTNGNTNINAIPNGTSTQAAIGSFNNSDPTNASAATLIANATEASVRSGITGTGTYLPMTFYTGGSERMRIGNAGQLGIGGANYGTAGQVLTSNGPSAAPSWESLGTFTTSASAAYTPAFGETLSRAHGLGFTPSSCQLILECVVADFGYSVGDKAIPMGIWNGTNQFPLALYADGTNCGVKCPTGFLVFIFNKTNGNAQTPTANAWKYYFTGVL